MNIEVELVALRLEKFLRIEICSPPRAKEITDKKASEIDLEEKEHLHTRALKMIL